MKLFLLSIWTNWAVGGGGGVGEGGCEEYVCQYCVSFKL